MSAEQVGSETSMSFPKIKIIDYHPAYMDGQYFGEPGNECTVFKLRKDFGIRKEEDPKRLQYTTEFS